MSMEPFSHFPSHEKGLLMNVGFYPPGEIMFLLMMNKNIREFEPHEDKPLEEYHSYQ